MKKAEQKAINEVIEIMCKKAECQFPKETTKKDWKRLRTMQAKVLETEDYFFLMSYATIVAFINKATDECVDVLRHEYGYTATSAKHISAFDHDYGKGKWGCKTRLTWRDC